MDPQLQKILDDHSIAINHHASSLIALSTILSLVLDKTKVDGHVVNMAIDALPLAASSGAGDVKARAKLIAAQILTLQA